MEKQITKILLIIGLAFISSLNPANAMEVPEGGCVSNLWVTPKGGVFATLDNHPNRDKSTVSFASGTKLPVFFSSDEGKSFQPITLLPSDNEDPLTSSGKFSELSSDRFYVIDLPDGKRKYLTNRGWMSKEGEELVWKDRSPHNVITDIVPFTQQGTISALIKYLENGEGNPDAATIAITDDFGKTSRPLLQKTSEFLDVQVDSRTGFFYVATTNIIYVSKDKGKNWKTFLDLHKIKRLKKNKSQTYLSDKDIPPIISIIIDSNDKISRFYVLFGYDMGHILKSDDNGMSWNEITVPETSRYLSAFAKPNFIVSAKHPNIFFYSSVYGLWRSEDFGEKWKQLKDKDNLLNSLDALAVDPVNDNILYAGNCYGVLGSKDGGISWRRLNTGIKALHVISEAHDQNNPEKTVIGTSRGGIYSTQNGGKSWSLPALTESKEPIRGIASNPLNTNTLYVYDVNNLYGSEDGGKTYYRCGTKDIPMSYSIQLAIPAKNDLLVTASQTLSTVKMLNGLRTVSKETKIIGRFVSNDKCVHFRKIIE